MNILLNWCQRTFAYMHMNKEYKQPQTYHRYGDGIAECCETVAQWSCTQKDNVIDDDGREKANE